jgi:hypothetical protein
MVVDQDPDGASGEGDIDFGISIRIAGTISPGAIGSVPGSMISSPLAPSSEARRDEIWFPVVSALSRPFGATVMVAR